MDSLQTVRKLRDKGVKIYFEKENIDSLDAKCDMILSIYSSLAEERIKKHKHQYQMGASEEGGTRGGCAKLQ
ncbi:MAG: hypothetical protein ACOX2Y_02900 [Christensenellales bacterium]